MEPTPDLVLFKSNGQPGLDALDDTRSSRTVFILLRLLCTALDEDATDVHIEPEGHAIVVRVRVDGFLRSVATYDAELGRHILSAIKVLCDLDITRKYGFQDGAFIGRRQGRQIDFRISLVQEVAGEKMVIRILRKEMGEHLIEELGMHPDIISALRAFSRRTQGTIFVAGPTGAGKTTTLYAMMQEVDRTKRNVVSIEDPVEYHLPLMTQIHVNTKMGMEFSAALRSVLRQDPNVIMVGEVRDRETAETALQSALTGHLILTTTHAKDAVGTIFRLLDLEIPPYQLVTSVDVVLAQRLARKLCERCKSPLAVNPQYFEMLGFPTPNAQTVFHAQGCDACGHTGYRGRTGVFELLVMTDPFRDAILRNAVEAELQGIMTAGGNPRLLSDAMHKVEQGVLSMEEVSRVLT